MKRFHKIALLITAAVLCIALAGCGSNAPSESVTAAAAAISLSETLSLGIKYLGTLDYASAILQYTAAIQEDPHNVEAYAGLYAAYVASGKTDEAEQVLNRAQEAIEDDDLLVPTILERAKLIYENGGGLEPIRQLSDFYSADLDELNGIAEERARRMRQIHDAWVEKDPDDPDAYLALCLLYAADGDEAEMEKLLAEAKENGTDMQELDVRVTEKSDGRVVLKLDMGALEVEGPDGETKEIPVSVEVPADGTLDATDVTTQVATQVADSLVEDVVEESGLDTDSAAGQAALEASKEAVRQGLSAMGDVPGMGDMLGNFGY